MDEYRRETKDGTRLGKNLKATVAENWFPELEVDSQVKNKQEEKEEEETDTVSDEEADAENDGSNESELETGREDRSDTKGLEQVLETMYSSSSRKVKEMTTIEGSTRSTTGGTTSTTLPTSMSATSSLSSLFHGRTDSKEDYNDDHVRGPEHLNNVSLPASRAQPETPHFGSMNLQQQDAILIDSMDQKSLENFSLQKYLGRYDNNSFDKGNSDNVDIAVEMQKRKIELEALRKRLVGDGVLVL